MQSNVVHGGRIPYADPTRDVRRVLGSRCAGVTIVEMIITLTIVLVVVSIFSRIVIATSGLKHQNRENAIAAEAARVVLEDMRNAHFRDVFALYNEIPGDDPDGPGTAPGHRFAVVGLTPREDSPDGLVGEVIFPADWLPPYVEEGSESTGGETSTESGTTAPELVFQLREDLVEARLGMPRDLSGDSIVDERDHAEDYSLLPILIRIDWQGTAGPRRFEVYTMLGSYVL